MSFKLAVLRGFQLSRSLLHWGLKPAARAAAKLRGEPLRGVPVGRAAQPRPFLPARYRYFRVSLGGLAAQLQSRGVRRLLSAASPRNRVVFLAFGLGAGLVEQQLEEDHASTAACREIQALFKKKFQNSFKSFTSGYKLNDYVIGKQIGKGCNAAVYEAAASFAMPQEGGRCPLAEQKDSEPHLPRSVAHFPLAMKMMWNIGAGSSSADILSSMSQELVPACPQALKEENRSNTLHGHFGYVPRKMSAHPNVITVYRAFTAEVPLLPGAQEEYPDVLPPRLNPAGMGNNRTLFLVMKNYPYTLRQYLEVSVPSRKEGTLMVLQLLEGVDHLCQQGIAHRDLKSDNVLVELDSDGCPHLVITDFGCCLAEGDFGLKLPFNSRCVNRGGNACLMAPEVATAVPGPGMIIDYSKSDAWAVGAIAYEIFGQRNPFYSAGPEGLDSRKYQEKQLPLLPSRVPTDTHVVVRLLLRRNPRKRPSARVAANMLHISLWGGQALDSQDWSSMKTMADWLLCQSAVVLLKGCSPSRSTVEMELQRCFLANVNLDDLRAAMGFLIFGRAQHNF
ncbi:serine/threonine-protein kinase PINK1, mitochondrial [Scleropages formosus]|uniref:Serine/threonine-protein kinase PINK1, mitochondrial n=1 Tax=Scleropages formosus TaxID=113540 RepID=A0A8C9S955_SCLFO|nr:serine/threonine-protein kinase PINK1, mitochondrial [Scleropages formosus]